jgi:tight adherence protein C
MNYVILATVFLSVAGLIMGVGFYLMRQPALDQRLEALHEKSSPIDNLSAPQTTPWQAKIIEITGPIARLSAPKEGGDASYLRLRLLNAGLRQNYWPLVLFSSKSFLALVFPLVYVMVNGLGGEMANFGTALFAVLLLAAFGYYLPNVVLRYLIDRRKKELQEAMPDALDLIMVCVSAGLAIDAAIKRTCEELSLRSPALTEELSLVSLELQVGASRESAMHNLSLRTGVDDITSFVTILLQSEHFGTNVAESLRLLADTMRQNRRTLAEEQAAKIPLKLLFPVIFCIFPSLFVVLLGPAMMSIYKNFLNPGG